MSDVARRCTHCGYVVSEVVDPEVARLRARVKELEERLAHLPQGAWCGDCQTIHADGRHTRPRPAR